MVSGGRGVEAVFVCHRRDKKELEILGEEVWTQVAAMHNLPSARFGILATGECDTGVLGGEADRDRHTGREGEG